MKNLWFLLIVVQVVYAEEPAQDFLANCPQNFEQPSSHALENQTRFREDVLLRFFVSDWAALRGYELDMRESDANRSALRARTHAIQKLAESRPDLIRDRRVWAFEPMAPIYLYANSVDRVKIYMPGTLVIIQNDYVVANIELLMGFKR